MILPLVVLALLLPPAPAHLLNPPQLVPAMGSQRRPVMATSGQETLVAWYDNTLGRLGAYVSALSEDGTVIPGTQRLVAEPAVTVQITWTGQSYLILWNESGGILYATEVDSQTRTLVPNHFVSYGARVQSNVEWIGTRGAVVASRALLLLDRHGTIVGGSDDLNPNAAVLSARVVTDGQIFYVFWSAVSEIYVRRYSVEGQSLDAAPTLVGTMPFVDEQEWDAAIGGGRLAVVATESGHETGEDQLRTYVIAPDTLQVTALDPLHQGIAQGTHVEWVGDRFVTTWLRVEMNGASTLMTRAFTAAGVAEPAYAHGAGLVPRDEVADLWTSERLLYTFIENDGVSDGDNLYAASVDWRGAVPDTRSVVALSHAWEGTPAAATNGYQSLIAWTEGAGIGLVRLGVVHTTAGVVDTQPIYLTETAAAGDRPVVLYTGSMYLVFWLEIDRTAPVPIPFVMMQRVRSDGVRLDSEPLALARGFDVAAAWNGTHVMVGWIQYSGAIGSARLTGDGVPFDATATRVTSRAASGPLAIASNGSDFLFVWIEGSDGEFPVPDLLDLYAARVDAAGTVMGDAIAIATGPANQQSQSVASDGRDFVIAYQHDEKFVTKKVLREGALAGTTAADEGTLIEAGPSRFAGDDLVTIAATRTGYVMAWELAPSANRNEVHMAELNRDGAAITAPQNVATSPLMGMRPVLATSGGDAGELVYAVLQENESLGAVMRLFIRRFGEVEAKRRSARH